MIQREQARNNGKAFAEHIGCYNGDQWDADSAENCLRGKTNEELFSAYAQGTFRSRGSVDAFSGFQPILPDLPENLLQKGLFNKVSLK